MSWLTLNADKPGQPSAPHPRSHALETKERLPPAHRKVFAAACGLSGQHATGWTGDGGGDRRRGVACEAMGGDITTDERLCVGFSFEQLVVEEI